MFGEPRKIVLVGVLAGAAAAAAAVGITAYVSAVALRSGWHSVSIDESVPVSSSESTRAARGDVMSGTVTAGPARGRSGSAPQDAALSGGLQAVRDSLQRNDLAAAQAHLDAVATSDKDDGQVVALRREVQARAAQQSEAVAQGDTTAQKGSGSSATRTSPTSVTSAKGHRSQERHYAAREARNYSRHAAGYGKNHPAAQAATAATSARTSKGAAGSFATAADPAAVEASAGANRAPSTPPSLKINQPATNSPTLPPPIVQPTPRPLVEQMPSPNPPAELSAQISRQAPLLQPAASGGTLAKADGPKTRAQVRDEIVRARDNGSLPAFGNPDPAGPGGAPSLTIAPRP